MTRVIVRGVQARVLAPLVPGDLVVGSCNVIHYLVQAEIANDAVVGVVLLDHTVPAVPLSVVLNRSSWCGRGSCRASFLIGVIP